MEIGRFKLSEMGNDQNLKCPVWTCFAIFAVNFRWFAKAFAPKNHQCPNELGRSWEYWDESRRTFIKSRDGMEVVCTDVSPAGMHNYRKENNDWYMVWWNFQGKPAGTGKQQQKGISPNHVPVIILFPVLYISKRSYRVWLNYPSQVWWILFLLLLTTFV